MSIYEQVEDVRQLLSKPDFFTGLVLLAIGLLIIGLIQRTVRGKSSNVVLVLGASGAGKTTLFHQLRDGSSHKGTVPSMQHNEDVVQLRFDKGQGGKVVDLVDVPGHPKVRGKAQQFYGRTRSIVFLVDAVDFMAQKSEVAEQLYEVLSNPTVHNRRLPVLLACNKADLGAKAHTTDFVRKRLEKELEQLRTTRRTLGESAPESRSLTAAGETFTFEGLTKARGPKVSLAAASALTGDLGEVLQFLKAT